MRYRHIAFAEEELRREFDYMVAAGLTPKNYGLRVRTHPDGMIVTALNKMSHSRTRELSWAGVLVQTTQLPKTADKIEANLMAVGRLLGALPTPRQGDGRATRVWSDVSAGLVAEFVESLQFPPTSARASGEQLAAFIRKQAAKTPAELTNWTVALVSHTQTPTDWRRTLAGFDIGLIERSPESQLETSLALKKSNILNPKDEGLDFDGPIFDQAWYAAIAGKCELGEDADWLRDQVGEKAGHVAIALTQRWQAAVPPKVRKPVEGTTQRANGRVLRVLRRAESGLLLIYPVARPEKVVLQGNPKCEEPTGLDVKDTPIIGVALSFPTSETTVGVEYRVNSVWGAEIAEDERFDDS